MAGRARTAAGTGSSKGNHRGGSKTQRTSYDQLKEFQGQRYTGMKVGRRHKWRYDAGEWTEKKVTPDKWDFQYSVVKRRAGKAPEGSGAPVGTAYRWYILADQVVTKLDANSYTTEMAGVKYKLAHRRADKGSWSASDRAQRKRLVQLLREMIADLEAQPDAEPAPAAATAAGGSQRAPAANGSGTATRRRRSSAAAGTRKAPASGRAHRGRSASREGGGRAAA